MSKAEGRLAFAVIGAGPVGVAIGQALSAAGHLLLGVSAVSAENVERVEVMLPGATLMNVEEILAQAELVILAIPATELLATVAGLAEAKLWRAGQLVVHTAGEYGFSILAPATQQGVIPLAIHPAMKFTGTSLDLSRMRESYFAVAAPRVALPIAQALVIEMGAEPLVIEEQDRAKYFEAFEVASNFSALVVNQAIGLLEELGVADARSVIAPVVRSAVETALAEGHRPISPEDLIEREPRDF
jgi:predicted short-subunit dehydrogenase-like oxidoreductase (DUF2520 family)